MKRPSAIARLLLPFSLYVLATAPASALQVEPSAARVVLQSAILRVAAPSEFIKLTLPDGSEGRLQAETVIRIRRTIASERESGALTRIDWIQTMLVKEPPEAVVTLVGAVLPSLGKLRLPDASPIWFNARAAEGPLPLADNKLQNGVLSGMVLGNRLQYLSSSPQEVHDEIAARGGSSLPVPPPFKGGERSVRPPLEVWDSDIRQ